MRILHVLEASVPIIAGYTSRSRAIVNAQRGHGWEPLVLTSARHSKGSGPDHEVIDGIPHYRTRKPASPWKHLLQEAYFLRQRVLEVARSTRPDLIHAHSPVVVGGPAWLASRQLGLPFVYEVRSLWEEGHVERPDGTRPSLRYRLSRGAETALARRVDALVCICEGLRQDFAARRLPSDRLFVVPNGVNISRFAPRPPDEATRARLGLHGKVVVGYIGTFYEFEGIRDLVDAMAKLMRQGRTDLAGLIVGAGRSYEACREAAAAHGLSDRILHPGHVPPDEVEKLYSVIDVLVYPRRRIRVTELVTPLKPLEAMAMEKAVIGSDVGGIRELVTDGATGLLFRSGNVDDLASAIERLLDDRSLRERLGRQGRAYVTAERGWSTLVDRYTPVYERARRS